MKQMFSKEELQAVSKEVADTEIDENLIANPTLEGDEETLSSIGIKGTNYAVGGGSEVHLYQHSLRIRGNIGTVQWNLENIICVTASNTPITINDIPNIGLGGTYDHITTATNSSNNTWANAIYYKSGDDVKIRIDVPGGTNTSLTDPVLTDTITQIF